uniref:Uncharacterized protein n=1 Tax=Meloidogyne incognita TaxID=6306 RepID=A0A914KHG0_MELIC
MLGMSMVKMRVMVLVGDRANPFSMRLSDVILSQTCRKKWPKKFFENNKTNICLEDIELISGHFSSFH